MSSTFRVLVLSLSIAGLALTVGCEKKAEDASDKNGDKTGDKAGDKTADETGDKTGDEATSARKPVELLEKAVERRLHPDRVEASSFLWNDWNRFQENYHPLYLIDDDPKTAWVEGASGAGENEWVRAHVTEVAEATKVRLRIRNGYHKSSSLHKKNARAKGVTVTLYPSEANMVLALADDMEWQTLEIEQDAGPLESIEIKVDSVFPGSKYADLCLSDLEVHVTSRTPENPDFERRKLAQVMEWKKERLEAAKLFAAKGAKEMPIAGGYRVVGKKELKGAKPLFGESLKAASSIISHAKAASVGDEALLSSADAAVKASFADWVAVEVSVKSGRRLPAVDGLYRPEGYEFADGGVARGDAYSIPAPGKVEFLTSNRLSTFESTDKITVKRALSGKDRRCKKENKPHYFYFLPKSDVTRTDGVLRRLLVVECGRFEERDGYYSYAGIQLLDYDGSGRLAMIIAPSSVSTYEWSSDAKLAGGKRVRADWNSKVHTDGLVLARK